ncbi:hypothetical protein SAMN06269117_1246 [Balnearium lithotrophicum]|uniref:Uncharacterized protein n=1 Tax=Balnearium lithotrophicum TaxID=223788 RepID=A0A521DNY6_9BACT|nr:hypothetical protein [Balnearium lithotrophicum]SMO73434.1 hypothetical protein SAMN06269117_1246 [Balnearium lithotrophicum]
MEKAKRDLRETYDKYLKEGLSKEEALSKAISEVRERHEEEKFKRALEEFLKEIIDSYKLENLAEADPVMALVESAYAEWEILWPKVKKFFEGR